MPVVRLLHVHVLVPPRKQVTHRTPVRIEHNLLRRRSGHKSTKSYNLHLVSECAGNPSRNRGYERVEPSVRDISWSRTVIRWIRVERLLSSRVTIRGYVPDDLREWMRISERGPLEEGRAGFWNLRYICTYVAPCTCASYGAAILNLVLRLSERLRIRSMRILILSL